MGFRTLLKITMGTLSAAAILHSSESMWPASDGSHPFNGLPPAQYPGINSPPLPLPRRSAPNYFPVPAPPSRDAGHSLHEYLHSMAAKPIFDETGYENMTNCLEATKDLKLRLSFGAIIETLIG